MICFLYTEKRWSINKISQEFDRLHYQTIKKILQEFNIELRTHSESKILHTKDSSYFDNIDSYEKAYWLGVMFADGFVGLNSDGTGTSKISLVMSDKDIVEKFRRAINFDGPIKHEQKRYYRLSFQDKHMANALVKQGAFNHKSLVLLPPKILDKYAFDFIRGYFDGDGGVNVSKNGKRIQMYFTGTYEMFSWIKETLDLKSTIRKEHRCSNNTYRLPITGRHQINKLFNKLYEHSSENSRMNRKYNIFNDFFVGRNNK